MLDVERHNHVLVMKALRGNKLSQNGLQGQALQMLYSPVWKPPQNFARCIKACTPGRTLSQPWVGMEVRARALGPKSGHAQPLTVPNARFWERSCGPGWQKCTLTPRCLTKS